MKTEQAAGRSIFRFFLLSEFAFLLLGFVGWSAWDVVWTDIVRHNPHRPLGHALLIIPMGAAIGGFLALIRFSAALLVAALAASIARKHLGRMPSWVLAPLLPLCALLAQMQGSMLELPPPFWITSEEEASRHGFWQTLLVDGLLLLPALSGAWWLARRTTPAHPSAARPIRRDATG